MSTHVDPSVLRPVGDADAVYLFTTSIDVHRYSQQQHRQRPRPLEVGEAAGWWTVQKGCGLGAWYLVYVAAPLKAVAWIGRTLSVPVRPSGGRHWYSWVEEHELDQPVPLSAIREDPHAGTWPGLRSLQGATRRIQPAGYWDALLALVLERNPGCQDVLERWTRDPLVPWAEPMEDVLWEGGPDWDYPFRTEVPLMRDATVAYLLGSPQFREITPEDHLPFPTVEIPMPGAGRADGVLVLADEPKHLLLIETKLFAASLAGVNQLTAYRDWLGEHHPDWAVACTLVAQEFSHAVLQACHTAGIAPARLEWSNDIDDTWQIVGLDATGSVVT